MDPYASQTPPPPPADPGTPVTWAAPEQPKKSSRLMKILVPIIAVIVIGGGLYGFNYLNAHKDAGKVLFSTDKPVAGQSDTCSPSHQVTSVKTGTSVWATFFFSDRPGDTAVSLSVTKDGASFQEAFDLPVADTKGLDCLTYTDLDLKVLEPGAYVFTLKLDGKTIAEGTLTVTP